PPARAQRVSFWLRAAAPLADVEAALALVVGAGALLAVTGELASPAYPLLYGVVAFAATFPRRAGALAALAAALALEAATLRRAGMTGAHLESAGVHALFLGAAAAAHAVFLRGAVARMRRAHDERLTAELLAQRQAARDFRLIAAPLGAQSRAATRPEEERLLGAGGVELIGATVHAHLRLLKRTLAARTCVLLWLDERGEALHIRELVTDADDVADAGPVAAAGAVGAVVHDRRPHMLAPTRPGQVPYIGSGRAVAAFLGVPVLDGAHLRGVLCCDRDQPFIAAEVELAEQAAEQAMRAVHAEQVFRQVERSKYEHVRFFHASAMLCEALTVEQVMDTAFNACAEIVGYDVAAISIFDRDRKLHRVQAVRARPGAEAMVDADALTGVEFRPNSGLVSMVVKNKHHLPAAGEPRDHAVQIWTGKTKLRDAESLLVLPLLVADEATGTLLLAARNPRRFGKDVREMLRVIASQVAVSLENAILYRKMETMATTDGLTGLTNHRSFQERFATLLDRAQRYRRSCAMLLCDVDHFKKVNDTYGHPVGDEVLRRVAKVLGDAARKIDIPARYGGEEFAVVLDEIDLAGARRIAERIRQDVGALAIESDKGPFNVTMSIGVAVFPADGADRAQLIEHADMALYHAKQSGRNRVVDYAQFTAARQKRAS
ncbi:MAG TPA: diguanylate cyclase, partial [Kofleriaceae bacterium]|nr:diguanylate cyclase [Kofleriaceae bacterium]